MSSVGLEEKKGYQVYDLLEPHCDMAVGYRDVTGATRYRCWHEAASPGEEQ